MSIRALVYAKVEHLEVTGNEFTCYVRTPEHDSVIHCEGSFTAGQARDTDKPAVECWYVSGNHETPNGARMPLDLRTLALIRDAITERISGQTDYLIQEDL